MKNPRAVGAAHRHVGMGLFVRKIEIDFAGNEIINNHMLARRTESERTLVFENVTGILQFF